MVWYFTVFKSLRTTDPENTTKHWHMTPDVFRPNDLSLPECHLFICLYACGTHCCLLSYNHPPCRQDLNPVDFSKQPWLWGMVSPFLDLEAESCLMGRLMGMLLGRITPISLFFLWILSSPRDTLNCGCHHKEHLPEKTTHSEDDRWKHGRKLVWISSVAALLLDLLLLRKWMPFPSKSLWFYF